MSLDEAIYLREDYFNAPKHSFRTLGERIFALPGTRLLDLGCARGEFLHYLHRTDTRHWQALHGVDLSPLLIAEARGRHTAAPFAYDIGAIESLNLGQRFDLVTASGVLGYLDNPGVLFRTASLHATTSAHMLVFGFLNAEEIDVYSEFVYRGQREKANLHSIRSLTASAAEHGFELASIDPFDLPFALARQPDNVRRAWTLETEQGRFFVNGLGQYFRLYLAQFCNTP